MDIKRVIGEIHRRSLWQVLAIYLGASWLVLQVAEHVVEQFGLPEWTYGVAFLLLLVGLPIVLATAFVQEGPPGAEHVDVPGNPPRAGVAAEPRAASHGLLTWRNALVGAVGASALWGVVAAGWLLVAPGRGEETGASDGAQITALGEPELREEGERGEGMPGDPEVVVEDEPASTEGTGAVGTDEERSPRDRTPVEPIEPERATRSDPPARGGRGGAAPAEDDERREYVDLLDATTRAGDRAREAGAVERGMDLSAPDSLLQEARAAESAGDLRRAQRELASARALYDDAARRAGAAWGAAADSAARAVEALRARARPSADGYEEGEADRRQAAAASGRGDHRGAVELLQRAAASYERALPAPAEAATDREAGAAEEAPPAEAELREVVRHTLGRLERALETEDLDALGRVWVTLDPTSADGFRSFFDRVRDFDVEIRVRWETLVASESRVAVSGVTTWSYYDERLREPATREPFEQTFELVRRDGEWVVVRY